VDIDRESRLLAEKAMRFKVASALVRGEINPMQEG
jgi:hypothetical protein